jgi:hypothetical protein
MVKFKAKIWKAGDGYVITIPKLYIDNDLLKNGKKYEFHIQEVNDAETTN